MKKVLLSILVIILLGSIITLGIGFKLNKSDNVTIKTYIDGELASAYPSGTDGYKVSSISCTNGASATFNYSTWRLEVSGTTSNTTCTVEFTSNDNETFANYLISKECSSTPTSDDAAKDCLVNENGYRYEGKNPNNYVLFNDELWRVIGVFSMQTASGTTENLVKLIRNETLDGLAWNSSSNNNWSAATLQQTLNNGYLNATDSTCNFYEDNTKTCYFSETGINSTARNMIESVVWNLGGRSSNGATADSFYTAERGTTVYSGRPTEWTGKVGLMYPSDYGYAVLASSCGRTTGLGGDYSSTACAGNNWLKSDSYQWTLTPISSSSNLVFSVSVDGHLNYSRGASDGLGARPSIYLKSNIAIMGGSGSYSDPYLLS